MNHYERCAAYLGKTVEVYEGRVVRITGTSTPGDAFCIAVDGGDPIHHVSTAFLQPDNLRAAVTFEQFQATRRECDHAGMIEIGYDVGQLPDAIGFAYQGGLVIEKTTDQWLDRSGAYYLMLENLQFVSDDLAQLERRLYGYALRGGFLE